MKTINTPTILMTANKPDVFLATNTQFKGMTACSSAVPLQVMTGMLVGNAHPTSTSFPRVISGCIPLVQPLLR